MIYTRLSYSDDIIMTSSWWISFTVSVWTLTNREHGGEERKREGGGRLFGPTRLVVCISHLQCMIEVAVRGVLDADGGHSSSGVGDGTGNEPGGPTDTTHCRSNKRRFYILGEI